MDFYKIFFDTKDFKITETKLGKGVFGAVYIAERIQDHKKCAAKIIDILSDIDGKDQMMIMRESSILSKLDHESIIKFYGLNFRSLRDMTKFQPTIITEYMPNKSLKEMLDKEKSGLADPNWSPTKKYICLLGISNAMKYLHEHDILHRDLKPENILMDENYYPKVCDFGLSRCLPNLISSSMKKSLTGKIGTPLYMAPELINDDDTEDEETDDENKNKYDKKIDVYAFAILAYEIVTGKQPFYELGEKVSLTKLWNKVSSGARPKFTDDVPEKMKNLISQCWSKEPKNRPSFSEIFQTLSFDFSYSPEDVEEDEVYNYLDLLENNDKKDDDKKDDKKDDAKDGDKKDGDKKDGDKNQFFDKFVDIDKENFLSLDNITKMLHFACETGNIKFLEYLLSIDSVDINAKIIQKKKKYFLIAFFIKYFIYVQK